MSELLNLVTTKAQFLRADGEDQTKITNVTNTTLYFDDTEAVSSGTNDGSLTQGQSKTFTAGTWLRPIAPCQVLVDHFTGEKQGAPIETRFAAWSPVAATSGTDVACDNGSVWASSVFVPVNTTLTGIEYLIGSVGGTHAVIVILYDGNGQVRANSDLAGVTVGTAANTQQVAFTAPVSVTGPARYYLAVQFSGTTPKFRAIPGFTGLNTVRIKQTGGTFGTLAALSPTPTAMVADVGPVASTY